MKRAFTISAAWSAAATWLELAVGTATFLTVARLVTVEEFGVAAMAFAFLFVGEALVRETVTEGIIQRRELGERQLEATFVAHIAFSLVIMAGLFVVAHVAADFYRQPEVRPLLIAASPTVLLLGLSGVPTALLRREMAFRSIAFRIFIGVACGGVVAIVMALNGFGAWSLVGQRLVEIGVNCVLAFRAAGWKPRQWPKRADFALVRGVGMSMVLLRAVTIGIVQMPTVALGIVADPRSVGLFAIAARLIELATSLIVKPLQNVAVSTISALRRQHASTADFYLELNEVAALGGFTTFTGLALVANPLVGLLLGEQWRDAGLVLPWLCLWGGVVALTAMQEAYLLALDRLGGFVRAAIVELALGLLVISLAAPHGAAAVAAAVGLRALAALVLRTASALKPEAIRPARLANVLVAPILVAGGMTAIVGLWRYFTLGRLPDMLFVASAIGLGVATVAALLLGLMGKTVSRLRSFVEAET
jgi:PST family polysaccharide transporter